MKDDELKECFATVMKSMADSYFDDVEIPFDVSEIDFKEVNPDTFWYKYIEGATDKQKAAYEEVISKKTNRLFASILVHHHDLEWELSRLFNKEFGHICSTDKASHVLRYCRNRALGEKATIRKPFVKISGGKFYQFIENHPFISFGKIQEFAQASQNLLKSIEISRIRSRSFAAGLYLDNSNEEILINKEPVTFASIVKGSSLGNAVDWLRSQKPDKIAIYKSRIRNSKKLYKR